VESITARHKERKQGHESLRVSGLDSIIVEKNSDHLKYATMGIQYLMPFLNYRFLEENTLNYIRSRLEFAGFISAIDKEYQDEISYLKETLQRNKDYERTIWNEMGLIYTYLLDKEKDQFKAKTSYIEKAIECFDRSLILDKHKENRLPLVNKGFVYMEFNTTIIKQLNVL
jgi:tetratricopeptide (TPR) repeat protein